MNFLTKIEDLINNLLIRLQELFVLLLQKMMPAKVKALVEKLQDKKVAFKAWLKTRPAWLKTFIVNKIADAKKLAQALNIKARLTETYQAALARTKTSDSEVKGKFQALRKFLWMPFLVISQWLQGLSTAQSLLILSFSSASVLAIFSIAFEGQRLMKGMEASRAPASVEEAEVDYARPGYYKKQTKHVEFTSVRLPVYSPEVNELKSVDIDFVVTLSTREAKMWLEKKEFQLRDYLILQMEPVIASFPLEDEGKEVIRQKLIMEVNHFLLENFTREKNKEAHVIELKLTYLLAN